MDIPSIEARLFDNMWPHFNILDTFCTVRFSRHRLKVKVMSKLLRTVISEKYISCFTKQEMYEMELFTSAHCVVMELV